MLNLDSFHPILKKSNTLIKARIWMYSAALVHLVVIATWLLTIDFTKAEDPSLWVYNNTRWKMITSWFNLLTFLYFPASIYCDWRELRGEAGWRHVMLLNKARYFCFTSLLLPTTAFGDILFWRVWNKDRELIAPIAVDAIVPFWTQHCMHTVSLVWILMDLVMVPRERPRDMTLGITLLTAFLTAYMFVCVDSCLNGEFIYPGLKNYTEFKNIIPLVAYVYIENFFYYTSQFLIIDMLLTFLYFPASIYCDWRELRGEAGWRHVMLLNKARYFCFTSLLLPTTAFGDILFWRVWNKDRELIAPIAVDAIVPFWTQHCMHTVSLVWILMDLVMVPRERPRDMTLGITLLTAFLTAYMFVCVDSCLNGEFIYPGLKNYTEFKNIIPLVAYVYIENFFYYTSQFLIIDMVWGTKQGVKKVS